MKEKLISFKERRSWLDSPYEVSIMSKLDASTQLVFQLLMELLIRVNYLIAFRSQVLFFCEKFTYVFEKKVVPQQ